MTSIESRVTEQLECSHMFVDIAWVRELLAHRPSTRAVLLVYNTWLHTDLRTSTTSRNHTFHLVKPFTRVLWRTPLIVQVVHARDIGRSAYDRVRTVDVLQRAACLYLLLSDGRTEVHALAMSPLERLSDTTSPGTKLLLTGEVHCRRGVLQLRAHNVRVLGGRVDELCRQHSLRRRLATTLGMPADLLSNDTMSAAVNRPAVNVAVIPARVEPPPAVIAPRRPPEPVTRHEAPPPRTVVHVPPVVHHAPPVVHVPVPVQVHANTPTLSPRARRSMGRRKRAASPLAAMTDRDDVSDDDMLAEETPLVQTYGRQVPVERTRAGRLARAFSPQPGVDDVFWAPTVGKKPSPVPPPLPMPVVTPNPRSEPPVAMSAIESTMVGSPVPMASMESAVRSRLGNIGGIKSILECMKTTPTSGVRTVHGLVSGILRRLSENGGRGWTMRLVIRDSTGECEVDTQHDFLARLLGHDPTGTVVPADPHFQLHGIARFAALDEMLNEQALLIDLKYYPRRLDRRPVIVDIVVAE